MINADIILAALAEMEAVAGDREQLQSVRLSIVRRRIAKLSMLVEQQRTDRTDVSPKPRLRACVEAWSECSTGEYNPACCRFPKSCSATVYDPERVTDADLEESNG